MSDVQLFDSIGRTRRVEVESTGRHGFQELKAKDLSADTLVWIHFGKQLDEGYGAIRIVILDNPGKYIFGLHKSRVQVGGEVLLYSG